MKVDDWNQKLSISLDQIHFWKDNRIKINEDHSFWSNDDNINKLHKDFVEDCLWTPDLEVKNAQEISVGKPTPFKILLKKQGVVHVESRNIHMTVPCVMDFGGYPFDQQV